jgi:uncharacterized protein (DUF1800 family)
VWTAPSPAGWPDEDEAWASPHAVVERLDWVKQVVSGAPGSMADDVRDYADGLFGDTFVRLHPPGHRPQRNPGAGAGAVVHVA